MITTEYISFSESLLSSLLGVAIVFLSLVFLALFVTVVSKIISSLEKHFVPAAKATTVPVSTTTTAAADGEAVMVAVIAAAVSEERREPLDRFVITNIQKI